MLVRPMGRVVTIDRTHPDPAVIADAARVLRADGLVAFPTETVYGLGARGLSPAAVAKIFAAKGRPQNHPLILHVYGETDARDLMIASPTARVRELMRACWPGPLTLVVRRSARVPDAVTGGGDTVALRSPDHPVARALIAELGEPIAAPSANRYQTISPTMAAHVQKSLGDAVDLVLDGGACIAGIESTVLDLSTDVPRVLRPGALPLPMLRGLVPDLVFEAGVVARGEGAHLSPGQDARHYAPRARVVLVRGDEAVRDVVAAQPTGAKVGVLACGELARAGDEHVIALPRDAAGYSRGLYAALHALDDAGADVIVIQGVPDDEAWAGARDRLERAAAREPSGPHEERPS